MNEEKSYPDAPGLSIIKNRGTCPKCGYVLDLPTYAYFENSKQ